MPENKAPTRKQTQRTWLPKEPGQTKPKINWRYQNEHKARLHATLTELNVHKPRRTIRAADVRKFQKLKEELRLSYASVAEKFEDWKYMSVRHFNFAKAYARNGRSNAMAAMREAIYPEVMEKGVLEMASQSALKVVGMQELIAAFEFEEKAKMKLNIEDVVVWFQRIATAAMDTGDFSNANRAMENLGKYLGMFVERKEITHKVVHNKQELEERIVELTSILKEAEPDIEARLRIH